MDGLTQHFRAATEDSHVMLQKLSSPTAAAGRLAAGKDSQRAGRSPLVLHAVAAAQSERGPMHVWPSALFVRAPSPLATPAMRLERAEMLRKTVGTAPSAGAPKVRWPNAEPAPPVANELVLQYLANFERPAPFPASKALFMLGAIGAALPRRPGMDYRHERGRAVRAIAAIAGEFIASTEPTWGQSGRALSAQALPTVADRALSHYEQVLAALDKRSSASAKDTLPMWPMKLRQTESFAELASLLFEHRSWLELFERLEASSDPFAAADNASAGNEGSSRAVGCSRDTLEALSFLYDRHDRNMARRPPPSGGSEQAIRRARHLGAPALLLKAAFGFEQD